MYGMRILIVGLGSIGAGFDTPEEIENHASASSRCGFNLIGGVDYSLEKRSSFKSRFEAPVFADLRSARHLKPDIVVVATNPQSHLELVESANTIFPDAILICEKPLGFNHTDSLKIVELISQRNAKLYVNYSRQFSKGFQELSLGIKGKLLCGTITYNYGLTRSCSHYIRLCISLFGKPRSIEVCRGILNNPDNPSFRLNYGAGAKIDFIGTEDTGIRVADFHFVTDSEVIHIQQGNNWEILEMDSDSSPKWCRELRVIKSGDFFGGMTDLYSRLINESHSELNLGPNLMDDLVPNSIIDEVISNGK